MSILKNAIDSIILGLEDYQSADNRRLISCARNIFAGILLLFKYKLSILSPDNSDEVLIKQKIYPTVNKDGNLEWKGKGKKTVDVIQIQDRFESLGINVDWNRVKRINEYRNDIEHYYSELNKKSAESIISDTFIIIRDFISIHLQKDPKELLGEFAWKILLKVSEVYEKEKKECNDKLEKLDWKSYTAYEAIISFKCINCGSSLITVKDENKHISEAEFYCKNCNKIYEYEDIVEDSLKEYFSYNLYLSIKEGEVLELTTCPFCLRESYLYSEKKCAICGESAVHICARCGSEIPPEEINEGQFCDYCSYIMDKDD